MGRKFKITFFIIAFLFVGSVGLLYCLYSFTNIVDQALVKIINHYTDDDLKIEYHRLTGNLFGTVRIDDIRLTASGYILNCSRLELDYSLLDILEKKYLLKQIVLINPVVFVKGAREDSITIDDSPPLSVDSFVTKLNLVKFPQIIIDRLIVRNGSLIINNTEQKETIRDIQIELALEISEQKVEIRPYYTRCFWENRDIVIQDLAFKFNGNKQRITFNQVKAKIPGLEFIGKGEIEFYPHFRVLFFPDISKVDLTLVHKFFPDFPYQEGYFSLEGSFLSKIGKFGDYAGKVSLKANFDSLQIDSLSFDYEKENNDYLLNNIFLKSNFGIMNGSAEVKPLSTSKVNLSLTRFNFKKAGITEKQVVLNGSIDADVENWNLTEISGRGNLFLHSLKLGFAKVDTLVLNVKATSGDLQFEQPSYISFGRGSKFLLEGQLDKDRQLNLQLSTVDNNLDTLLNRFALTDMGGSGSLDLNLYGDLADPSLKGDLTIDSLRYKNSIIYGIYGESELTNIIKNRQGFLDLELATGYLEKIFLTSGELKLRFSKNRIVLNPLNFYSEENSFFSRGYVSFLDSLIMISMPNLEMNYDNYNIRNSGVIEAKYVNDSLYIDAFTLQSSQSGLIELGGYLAPHGNSNLSLDISNISLDPFTQYIYWDHNLKGNLETQVELYGDLSNPEIDLSCTISEIKFDAIPYGKILGDFSLKDGGLTINVIDYEGNSESYLTVNGNVDIQLKVNDSAQNNFTKTPLDLNIVFGNFSLDDYTSFYKGNYPIAGNLTGRLDLQGNIENPHGTLNISGKKFRFGDYKFPRVNLDCRFNSSKVVIENANVNFLDTEIKVQGEKIITWDPQKIDSTFVTRLFTDRSFSLSMEIKEDSLNFLNVLNPEIDRLTGDITFKGRLKGDYKDPQLIESSLNIENGKLYLSKLENEIGDLSLMAHLDGSKLVIENFTARSPKKVYHQSFFQSWVSKIRNIILPQKQTGDIRGKGTIDLKNLTRPKYNLEVELNNSYLNYFLESTELVVSSGNLSITGQDTINILGAIQINEGDVELDFEQSQKNVLLSSGVREEPPFLRYALDVEILPNFNIRSTEALNSYNMSLSGDLQVTQEPKSKLEMLGVLETTGKYFIQGEDFEIQTGKIEFVNPKELPEVNVVAQKRKNNLVFNLNVRGRLDSPEKEIVIQDEQGNTLPYPDVKDQMALLLFGVTFSELGTGTDVLLLSKGEQVVTQAVISAIEKEARSFTGLDQIRLDSQDSFFTSRLNQPPTLSLGKYLTSKLYLEYKSQLASSGLGNVPVPQLSWEAGNQIYLQYRLNRNWSFSTFYQKTQSGNGKVKLDINWQLSF